MIPQNFKDILANAENTGLYQSLAMVLFILFFCGIIYFVFSKPKKFYNNVSHLPLEDSENDFDSSKLK